MNQAKIVIVRRINGKIVQSALLKTKSVEGSGVANYNNNIFDFVKNPDGTIQITKIYPGVEVVKNNF